MATSAFAKRNRMRVRLRCRPGSRLGERLHWKTPFEDPPDKVRGPVSARRQLMVLVLPGGAWAWRMTFLLRKVRVMCRPLHATIFKHTGLIFLFIHQNYASSQQRVWINKKKRRFVGSSWSRQTAVLRAILGLPQLSVEWTMSGRPLRLM